MACPLLWVSPACAEVEDFRVLAIGVDNLSTVASAKAMDYARKRAVYLAIKKLGVKDPAAEAARLTEAQMNGVIRGATVAQSRREDKTTYEEVVVTVVNEALRKALDLPLQEKVAAPARARSVLVLPVLVGHDRPYLWEKENILRAPLSDALLQQSHGVVLTPAGDFGDLRLIDYQNALKVKPDELTPMFERYGAQEIIIAVLTPGAVGTMDSSSVLLRRLSLKGEQNEVLDIPPGAPEERAESRLNTSIQAIAAAVTQIATSTAQLDQERLDKAVHIPVDFQYANTRELASMQEMVRHASGVLLLELPNISLKAIRGTIYLEGNRETLKSQLIKQGIHVTPRGEAWQLSMR